MASCDRPEDYLLARKEGWSTFRVINEGDELFPEEIVCPNRKDDTVTSSYTNLSTGMV
jgi:hypothetical protein